MFADARCQGGRLTVRSERLCVTGAVVPTADAVHDWATWALLATRVPFQPLDQHGRYRSLARWRRVPLPGARGGP